MSEPELFARIQLLDRDEKLSYAEKGRICLMVRSHLLHQQRINPETGEPCGWTEWVRLAAPWGYSTCFQAVRDVEALSDVPAEDLAQVPKDNIGILRQLSTAVRAHPAVIRAAQTQRADEFIEQIKRDHPDQHIESHRVLRFPADETQASIIDKTIALSMERGAMSKTEALVDICVNYQADAMIEDLQKGMK